MNNPEEEKKGAMPSGKPTVPPKSVADISQQLEDCVIDAGNHNIDFLNYLCD